MKTTYNNKRQAILKSARLSCALNLLRTMEIAKLLETKFSTADAEYPVVIVDGGILTLKYQDWQENDVEIYFGEPVAYKWQMCEIFLKNERDDCCYEIENSKWLADHLSQGIVTKEEGYIHYRFNFNGNGQFEILAIGYMQKP